MDDADWVDEISARVRELQEKVLMKQDELLTYYKREVHALTDKRFHPP